MAPKTTGLSAVNVQTIIPEPVHKALRDIAYEQKKPLNALLKEVLTEFAEKNTLSTTKDSE